MKTPSAADGRPLLDPLALSAETSGRFRMLLAAAFIMAWSLAGYCVPTNPFYSLSELGAETPIVAIEGTTIDRSEIDFDAFWRAVKANPEAWEQIRSQVLQLLVSAGLIAAFILLSFAFFRRAPGRVSRRHSTRRLDPAAAPKLAAELDALARQAGLGAAPEWHVKPGNLDGLAFGLSARPVLAIAGEPGRLQRTWSDLHRAVALHELGHVVNRDTESREGVRAAWSVLALLVGLTALVLLLRGEGWVSMGLLAIRLAAVACVGLALWAGLVRSREYFADWRVARWGFGEALKRRLRLLQAFGVSASEPPEGAGARGSLVRRRSWRALIGFHPTNQDRLRMLAEPARLFRVSPSLALFTGMLLALAAGHLGVSLFQLFAVVIPLVTVIFLLAGGVPGIVLVLAIFGLGTTVLLPLTYWVVSALGVQVLRASVAELSENRSTAWGGRRLVLTALAFVAGVEVGLWLTPAGMAGWSMPGWMAAWLSVFTALVAVWLIQARALGRLVLGAWTTPPEPGRVEHRLRFLLTLLLMSVFWPALIGRASLGAAARLSRSGTEEFLGEPPEVFVVFCLNTSFMLLTAVLLFHGLLGILVFGAVGRWLRRRRPACRACGEPWGPWRTVGLRCQGCGEPRASWLYLQPAPSPVAKARPGVEA